MARKPRAEELQDALIRAAVAYFEHEYRLALEEGTLELQRLMKSLIPGAIARPVNTRGVKSELPGSRSREDETED